MNLNCCCSLQQGSREIIVCMARALTLLLTSLYPVPSNGHPCSQRLRLILGRLLHRTPSRLPSPSGPSSASFLFFFFFLPLIHLCQSPSYIRNTHTRKPTPHMICPPEEQRNGMGWVPPTHPTAQAVPRSG